MKTMKRRSGLVIFLITVAVTIGTLAATVGKPPYARHHLQQQCDKTTLPPGEQR